MSSDPTSPSDTTVSGRIEARLTELGLRLPGPFPPHDPLDAVVVHGGRARTSGQLPRGHDGRLVHPGVVGTSIDVEQGTECAMWCALNALSVLRAELGSLDRIDRVLAVLGFVACAAGYNADGPARIAFERGGHHAEVEADC